MNVRERATEILYRVLYQNGYANLILRNQNDLSSLDRSFLVEVVYGSLRNRYLLAYQWEDLVQTTIRPKTECLLYVSVYQLFFMDKTPDYAIVHDAVEIAPKRDQKFVNAILRKIQGRGLQKPENLSILTSHPEWILHLWKAHYGEEIMEKIAHFDQERAIVYGRINPLKGNREYILKDSEITLLENDCVTSKKPLVESNYFLGKQILIQDRSAQKIPYYLDVKPKMRVLDGCASPGMKTQEIAVLMENQGELIGNDLSSQRVQLITKLMEESGVTIYQPSIHDLTVEKKEWLENPFDRILLDVPCSGLGDLRHKPEIRYRLKPESIDELVQTQAKILDQCCEYLKVGGILVYSTCTLNRKENEGQIALFVKTHASFTLLEEKTFFPYENQSDGFYVAKLIKNA